MKKILFLSFALVFCCSTAFAGKSRFVETITASIMVEEAQIIYDAIVKGCKERGWIISESGENEIIATLDTRGHQVVVRIPYNENGYQIIYKDSKKMGYNSRRNTIHGKYNQWTANLDRSIKSNINFKK